jgi:surfactin synthase thioesterase subunit
VELLVVSAARPPGLNRLVPDRVLAMDRAEWIAELDLNGFGVPELMSNPDALDLIIPIMRADYLMLARHNQSSGPVRAPLLAMGGESDPWVTPEHLRAWGALTTSGFSSAQLPGGHFYYRDDLPAFGRLIRHAIADKPRRTAVA